MTAELSSNKTNSDIPPEELTDEDLTALLADQLPTHYDTKGAISAATETATRRKVYKPYPVKKTNLRAPPEILKTLRNDGWKDSAACEGMDDYHFPGEGGGSKSKITTALRDCASCIVRETCFAYSIDDRHGVVGGTVPDTRKLIRKAARLGAPYAKTYQIINKNNHDELSSGVVDPKFQALIRQYDDESTQ